MSEQDDLSMPPPEEEAPRRVASARLEVRGGPGREAMLREALDPANQSLRDALRLSFRVLQMTLRRIISKLRMLTMRCSTFPWNLPTAMMQTNRVMLLKLLRLKENSK